ncbi:MAG: YqeG family HAD IIIA-type phosphatase [Bacilli bacterium]|nr:YqeG family HAD IIIA-type phosphatase [Bacilli bacterium]
MKKYIPYAHAKNIYEIDICFFVSLHIKYLLVDLDNTLDSYKTLVPSDRAIHLKNELLKYNIEMIIVSNNTGKRVSTYANKLGVKYVNSIGKPFARGINKLIKQLNVDKNEVMLVGDQLMTDIAAANRAKIKSIYVEKLVKEDQITTRFNRMFERIVKRRLEKNKLFKEWGELNHANY